MPIKWNDSLNTGVEEIDQQHQELISRINNLLASMHQGEANTELMKVFQFLDDYVKMHFQTEEKIMAMSNYPQSSDHRAKHADFSKQVAELKKELETEGANAALVIKTQRWLTSWWDEHINNVDKELGAFLKK